jgi:hypothetical protein
MHSILAAGNQSHNLIKTIFRWELTIFGWMQMVIQIYERVESEIQELWVSAYSERRKLLCIIQYPYRTAYSILPHLSL